MTTTDWWIGSFDIVLTSLIVIYLLPVLISGVRHYENGYKPIRWALIFIFGCLFVVNFMAVGFDLDWYEMTDPVRVMFAFGRGSITVAFAALVWYIKHKT